MHNVTLAICVLALTLALVVAVDRGIPNTMDSCAYHLERLSRRIVAAVRKTAERLRQRHRNVEVLNRQRLETEG